MKICICEHIEACHAEGPCDCNDGCPGFQEQDLMVQMVQMLASRGAIRGRAVNVDIATLLLIKGHLLTLERKIQKLEFEKSHC